MSETENAVPGRVAEPVDTLVGKVLSGRFTVLERIGTGGMGRVYKAMQSPLDRLVALKVLNPSYSVDQDPAFAKRFFLEASVTAKLTHPNTITIFDYGRADEGVFYIAMEYLQGRTLHQIIAAEGSLPAPRVIHIARQMCRALREAHALGIVHRDLKPANVMLLHHGDDEDFVKVLDFGLVKFFNETGDRPPEEPELTQGGVFLGSPTYMAPEQARNVADPRSDVYSLGVVVYHMLAGRPPFQGKTPVDIILKHVNDPPPPFRPELKVPPDLEAVVLRALSKHAEERFQSMDAFLEALKRLGTLSPSDILTQLSRPHALPPPLPLPAPTVASALGPKGGHRMPTPLQMSSSSRAAAAPPEAPPRSRALLYVACLLGAAVLAVGVALAMVHLGAKLPPPAPAPIAEPVAPTPVAPAEVEAPPAPQPLTLRVESLPVGAEIRRAGALLGKTPLELQVDPASAGLALQLSAEGYAPAEVTPGRRGEGLFARVELKKLEPAHPSHGTRRNSKKSGSKPSGYKDDPYQ